MGCGCNKRNKARFAPPKAQVVPTGGTAARAAGNTNRNAVNALNIQNRESKLNQGGVSAEKRRVQAIRRQEILKRLGKA